MQKIVLVTGATGYIGGRLVPRLLDDGYRVRVMTRDARRLRGRSWLSRVEVVEADVLDPQTLPAALANVTTVFYLIHSMHGGDNYHQRDLQAAHNFGQAATKAGTDRIIYLGGLGDATTDLSNHLSSRQEVGHILHHYPVDVTEFRAAIIVGSGSASFEMIRYLTERVPVMICPQWVWTKVQPIAIEDALTYMVEALRVDETRNHVIEIGGADVMTYGDMMYGYAASRGLSRLLLPIPVLTPRLSSYWVHIVTPIPASIARPLIDGLRNEVIVHTRTARTFFPNIHPMSYRQAVDHALAELEASEIETTWSDALISTGEGDAYAFQEDQGMMLERRQREIKAPAARVFRTVSRIGGTGGWLYLNILWVLRGILDRLLGGPGYRGRRRDERALRPGDTLDFWRVEDVRIDQYLLLRAEMLMPGRGWLEFEITPLADGRSQLTQTAYYAPKGLWGVLYWYALFIPHKFIFDGMIDALVSQAESPQQSEHSTGVFIRRNVLPILGGALVAVAAIGLAIRTFITRSNERA